MTTEELLKNHSPKRRRMPLCTTYLQQEYDDERSQITNQCAQYIAPPARGLTPALMHLGVIIDPYLKWNSHIDHLTVTISRNIGIIDMTKLFIDSQLLVYCTTHMSFHLLITAVWCEDSHSQLPCIKLSYYKL